MIYRNFSSRLQDGSRSSAADTADLQRAVVYVGYKFNERFLFNSELEIEHGVTASDKGGETEMEFAYADYLWKPQANLRAGLVLIPFAAFADSGNQWVPYPLSYDTWAALAGRRGFAGTRLMTTVPSRFLREIYSAESLKPEASAP